MPEDNYTDIKILRSFVYNKRPNPTFLLEGQPAFNGNADQPGLYLKNSDNQLTKVGPVAVGATAPNDPTDPDDVDDNGTGTLSLGEQWLDKSDPANPILKTWDGEEWVVAMPPQLGKAIILNSPPPPEDYQNGHLWWNSETGHFYILYNSDWIQIGSSAVNLS